MALKYVVKNGAGSYVDTTPEEDAQAVVDEQKGAELSAARQAEATRQNTFSNDAGRQEFLDELKTKTAAEIETFVRNRVDASSVNDVASAQACLGRTETAIVRIMQLLAFNIVR
jgi:hypothetical protein